MSSAFKRTLLASLVASTFVVGMSVAAAAGTDAASPSSDANAAASAAGAQPSGGTSAAAGTASTATTPDTTGGASTTPGTSGKATDTNASTTQAASSGTPIDSQVRRVFDQLDTNHDGMLSFEEFSRATIQRP